MIGEQDLRLNWELLIFKVYMHPANAVDKLHEAVKRSYCKRQEKGRKVFLLQVVRKEILFTLSKLLLNFAVDGTEFKMSRAF